MYDIHLTCEKNTLFTFFNIVLPLQYPTHPTYGGKPQTFGGSGQEMKSFILKHIFWTYSQSSPRKWPFKNSK